MGLVPAAGRGTRLGRLSFSKELYPVPGVGVEGRPEPRPVIEHLLEALAAAGIEEAFVLLRAGKGDVAAHLGEGLPGGPRLAYLELESSGSIVETLDRAYPLVRGCRVAMGFPDVLFRPADAFVPLLDRLERSDAAVVLGLFPTDRAAKSDMVRTGAGGRVTAIEIKPARTALAHTWMLAVWRPVFTEHLHRFAASAPPRPDGRELYPSDALTAALGDGLPIDSVRFETGSCLDVGTPEDLARALGGS